MFMNYKNDNKVTSWIINLINIIVVDIISKRDSFKKLFPDPDPLIATQKIIPKSIIKLVGIVRINMVIKKKPPNDHIKILFWINVNEIEENIKRFIVKNNSIAKKRKSSTGPTAFSVEFSINNFVKLFITFICFI